MAPRPPARSGCRLNPAMRCCAASGGRSTTSPISMPSKTGSTSTTRRSRSFSRITWWHARSSARLGPNITQLSPLVPAGPAPAARPTWETTTAASAVLRPEAPAVLSRFPSTSPGSLISLDASAAKSTRRNTAAQVSAADLENERLAEETSLAQFYFEIRGQDQLQKVLDDTVTADRKAFDLTQSLYEYRCCGSDFGGGGPAQRSNPPRPPRPACICSAPNMNTPLRC